MSKWFEFKSDNDCKHAEGLYENCPFCRIESLKQELASYMESDENLRKKVEWQQEHIDAILGQPPNTNIIGQLHEALRRDKNLTRIVAELEQDKRNLLKKDLVALVCVEQQREIIALEAKHERLVVTHQFAVRRCEELEAKIQRVSEVESEIRHGWSFAEDPRSSISKFRKDCADKIKAALLGKESEDE